MKTNVGTADRIIRLLIVIVITVLYYFKLIDGALGNVLLALAGIFLVTAIVGFCPAYAGFGIRSCSSREVNSVPE
jgi:amino acid transporter